MPTNYFALGILIALSSCLTDVTCLRKLFAVASELALAFRQGRERQRCERHSARRAYAHSATLECKTQTLDPSRWLYLVHTYIDNYIDCSDILQKLSLTTLSLGVVT